MEITNFGQSQMVRRVGYNREDLRNRRLASTQSSASATGAANTFAKRISELKAEFENLRALVDEAALGGARPQSGATRSVDRVTSLSAQASASSVASAEQVNTAPTSVDNRSPGVLRVSRGKIVAGIGTSKATIGGTYTGAIDKAFALKVVSSTTVGGTMGWVRFDIYENGTNTGRSTTLSSVYTPGDPLSVGDGLDVSFDVGKLRMDEYFEFNAYASVATDLDPTKAFNGTGAESSGLSDATPVVDGSVKINGTEVVVNASDSLNDLLDRINSSGAGVTASFDAAADAVHIVNNTAGDADITFTDDSSGIVAALKLDTATVTRGADADRTLAVDDVGGFAGVSSGTMTINGVDIAIDTATDSLDDILDRINSSEAGVNASYSDSTGRLSIVNKTATSDLVIDGDNTGLLGSLKVDTGTYAATERRGMSAKRAEELTEAMASVVKELNDLFVTIGGSAGVSAVSSTQNSFSREMRTLSGSGGRTQLGIGFNFSGSGGLVEFDDKAQSRFRSALSGNAGGVAGFLEGRGTKDGFFDIVEAQVSAAESALAAEFGSGILVSTTA